MKQYEYLVKIDSCAHCPFVLTSKDFWRKESVLWFCTLLGLLCSTAKKNNWPIKKLIDDPLMSYAYIINPDEILSECPLENHQEKQIWKDL